MEKLNDLTTKQYFRGSNKKESDSKNEKFSYLKQLFQKRARLEYYRLNSATQKVSASYEKKKIKEKMFYLEKDLFEIRDLNELPSMVKEFEVKNQEVNFQDTNMLPNDLSVQQTNNFTEDLLDDLRTEQNQSDYIIINRDESEDIAASLMEELPDDFYDDDEVQNIEVSDSTNEFKRFKITNTNETHNTDLTRDNYIYYQVENIYVMRDDIKCCNDQNWLTNTCINAFMKTFDNKNCFVLDYIQANKFMTPFNDNNKIQNIFPKVKD